MSGIEKNPKEKTPIVLRSVVNTGRCSAVRSEVWSSRALEVWSSWYHGHPHLYHQPSEKKQGWRNSSSNLQDMLPPRWVLSLHVKDTTATLKGRLLHFYKQVVAKRTFYSSVGVWFHGNVLWFRDSGYEFEFQLLRFLAVRLGQAWFPYLYSDTTIVSNVVVKVTCFKFFFQVMVWLSWAQKLFQCCNLFVIAYHFLDSKLPPLMNKFAFYLMKAEHKFTPRVTASSKWRFS